MCYSRSTPNKSFIINVTYCTYHFCIKCIAKGVLLKAFDEFIASKTTKYVCKWLYNSQSEIKRKEINIKRFFVLSLYLLRTVKWMSICQIANQTLKSTDFNSEHICCCLARWLARKFKYINEILNKDTLHDEISHCAYCHVFRSKRSVERCNHNVYCGSTQHRQIRRNEKKNVNLRFTAS